MGTIENSLFSFIWTHSKRQQILLVAVTLLLFPLLYLTLELPKRIINDAIGAGRDEVTVLGLTISQNAFLVLLSFAFLLAVLVHGLLKMRVNTMKGVLAERMLKQFRYVLIGRILRFPQPYLQKTSEGELTSMITAEAEPLGGIMGDAYAQPILQAGQMLTVLWFLFAQSFWFGLAAVALIPLQAWLIPMLQRRINVLNKRRIVQVRELASDIGEIARGSVALRQHGGWQHRLDGTDSRLARLLDIRFEIYQKKFFMKFLNNFITQLTPFFFFLVGGLLVIQDQITVGALVAALSAFKDISSPWKELLAYYTQIQEMAQRYQIVVERFSPKGLFDDYLTDVSDDDASPSDNALRFDGITSRADGGQTVVDDLSATLDAGAWTVLVARQEDVRTTFAQLLTREIAPDTGAVSLGNRPLQNLPRRTLAAQIGYAAGRPAVFSGTLADNVLMALPQTVRETDDTQTWWSALLVETGALPLFLRRALDTRLSPDADAKVSEALASLRPAVRARLEAEGLVGIGRRFVPDRYHNGLTLPENLLYGVADPSVRLDDALLSEIESLLTALGLKDDVLQLAIQLTRVLIEAFDPDATDHPLFVELGLPQETFVKLRTLALAQQANPEQSLSAADISLFLTVPFRIPAEKFERAFSEEMKAAIVAGRDTARGRASPDLQTAIRPLDPETHHPALNVLETLIFGRMPATSDTRASQLRACVGDVLMSAASESVQRDLVRHLPVAAKGANLGTDLLEHIGVMQAAIKKPSLLILDRALPSAPEDMRLEAFSALRRLLPETTIVQLEAEEPDNTAFDKLLIVKGGKLVPEDGSTEGEGAEAAESDLARKIQAIQPAPLFENLGRKQIRMLAFSARWMELAPAEILFHKNDPPDGAYLVVSGTADLFDIDPAGQEIHITEATKGVLVGELGLIRKEPRRLSMRAKTELTLLYLGAEAFMSVVENDSGTAVRLMRTIAGYLGR